MKRIALAGLALVVAIGCHQSPPVGSTPTSGGSNSTSAPGAANVEAADLQLVSLSIPAMD